MVMREGVYLCLQIPATLIFTIVEKVLVVMVEVDIGLIPATLTPITQVVMVYFFVYLLILVVFMKVLMVIKEVILVVMVEDVY